jgi:hypothetical protein
MVDAYMSCAALLCASCGEARRAAIAADGEAPADPADESSYDSDAYPKGPYPDGGGEADTPQHCDACGTFLENPLTPDGLAYVREAIAEAMTATPFDPDAPALKIWREFYADELEQYTDSEFGAERRAGYQEESAALLKDVSPFVRYYLGTATEAGVEPPLWDPRSGGDRLTQFAPDDIAPEALRPMIGRAAELESALRPIIERAAADESFRVPGSHGESIWEAAGSFARLEAEGSGVGFWDGRWNGYGDELSDALKQWSGGINIGESIEGLYFGDDGGIYGN